MLILRMGLRRAITALLLLLPLVCSAEDVLTASFPDDLNSVQVRLCFEGPAPARLYRHEQAGRYSPGVFHDGNQLEFSRSASALDLPALPANACLNWQTDFTAALDQKDYRLIMQRGDDLVMSANLWFWKGTKHRDLLVDIQLPAGMSISTPWEEVHRTASTIRFRPDKTSANWESRVAVGDFDIDIITTPGSEVRLAVPGKISASQKSKIRRWIIKTVNAVTSVYGRFPQPHPQVLVVPIGHRNEAVVKAHVIRGGGMAVEFYIDETRPLEEFMDDWTATHEFSHMLIPYVSSRDRWLSEGMASYYQNVLRARDGRLSETQAWQKLYDGFKRGEKGTHGGTLAQATRRGRGSTMRVYWSGAAMMLLADIQLREISQGRQSLDTALQSLSACCMSNGKTWRAWDLFQQLDNLTGTRIFTRLYRRYVNDTGFPDMRQTWKDLGINARFDRVSLNQSGRLADMRTAIMKQR